MQDSVQIFFISLRRSLSSEEMLNFPDLIFKLFEDHDHPAWSVLQGSFVYQMAAASSVASGMFVMLQSRVLLGRFLKTLEPENVELLICATEPEKRLGFRRFLDLESLRQSLFQFEENLIYDIWPSHVLGPAHLKKFWPPVKLTLKNIGGPAPELFDYQKCFAGKTWADLKMGDIENNDHVFCCMDMQTLELIFPACLIECHSFPESFLSFAKMSIRFFAIREGFIELMNRLTPAQVAFSIHAMDFIMRDAREEERDAWAKVRNDDLIRSFIDSDP